jgi:type II secretory pathway component HofQ
VKLRSGEGNLADFPDPEEAIRTTSICSLALVRGGSTLTIGEIFEFESGEWELNTSQVPLVGDLPVLRLFFRNMGKKNSVRRKELMTFVTPKIIDLQ